MIVTSKLTKQSDPKSEVYDIEICIGNSQAEHILLYENDAILEVAQAFCDQHHLDSRQKEIIAKKIEEAVERDKNDTMQQIEFVDTYVKRVNTTEKYEEAVSENVEDDDDQRNDIMHNPVKASRQLKPRLNDKKKNDENWESVVKEHLRKQTNVIPNTGPKQVKTAQMSTRCSSGRRGLKHTYAPSPESIF